MSPSSPEGHLETEKKVRREIANSNERRRMQSINAGFQSLKTLIPHDGEKLSKVNIYFSTFKTCKLIQCTSEYTCMCLVEGKNKCSIDYM